METTGNNEKIEGQCWMSGAAARTGNYKKK